MDARIAQKLDTLLWLIAWLSILCLLIVPVLYVANYRPYNVTGQAGEKLYYALEFRPELLWPATWFLPLIGVSVLIIMANGWAGRPMSAVFGIVTSWLYIFFWLLSSWSYAYLAFWMVIENRNFLFYIHRIPTDFDGMFMFLVGTLVGGIAVLMGAGILALAIASLVCAVRARQLQRLAEFEEIMDAESIQRVD